MTERAHDIEVGREIGPYRIVRQIGGGGMGVVYEAADEALNRTVALKVISPSLARDAGFRARFTREAQALAALDSPNVVHVYAHGEVDGQLYIATQLVPDGDLGAWLRQFGPPPLKVALDLLAQVATGLADAHEGGMIHRDIKPANILLRRRGNTMLAYLSDFGIARRIDPELTEPDHGEGTIGTPSYMAPELHTGTDAGVQSDVYSLGCLLWATLTGRAPYVGTSEYQIVAAHREQPVPQLPGNTALVHEVNRILRTAMAKNAAERYATAAQLRDDLRRAKLIPTAGPAIPAQQPSSQQPWLVVVAVLVGVALVVAAIAWGLSATGGGERPPPGGDSTGASRGSAGPADQEQATRRLADALEAQGPMDGAEARCTAEHWIAAVGLQTMVDEGLFDDRLRFHDQQASAMSDEMRSASTRAAVTCARS